MKTRDRILVTSLALFARQNRSHLLSQCGQSFSELMEAGLRIGVIEDYLYGDPISTFQDDPAFAEQFSYSAMAETNISRLLDGAVDGIIEDKFVGASIIRHKNLVGAISPHPEPFTSNPVRIMVSRASVDEELFAKLNASVEELQGNGAIDKVLEERAQAESSPAS